MLPFAESLLPTMTSLFERWDSGESARGLYEQQIYHGLGTLSTDQAAALRQGFVKIRELPARLQNCVFDWSLADRLRDQPLEPADVQAIVGLEGVSYFANTFYPLSFGVAGPGQVRLWDVEWFPPPNGSSAKQTYTGPWPWITAIRPELTGFQEFGNRASYRPAPKTTHTFEEYQFNQTCTPSFNPANPGTPTMNCVRQPSPAPAPGALAAPYCEGGIDYTEKGFCLRILSTQPGAPLSLRGFNFITPTIKVRLVGRESPFVQMEVEAAVFGDLQTPQREADGSPIVDLRVQDFATFTLPRERPGSPGTPLPPGIYEVTAVVDNVLSATYHGTVSPQLTSNTLLIRIEPDPNIAFHLWSQHGHCFEETDGLGSDEIWFDAWVGHFKPQAGAAGKYEIQTPKRISFDRGAWDDMDSGEDAGSYAADLWDGSFGLGGLTVVGLIGFEVDSEAAARDQIQDFGDALVHYLEHVIPVSLAGASFVEGLLTVTGIVVSIVAALIVVAIIAVIILVIGLFWAAWAPADRIAVDVFALDGINCWKWTEPNSVAPPETQLQFEEVTTTHDPIGPDPTPSTSALYRFYHHYQTPDDGEDSHYGLEFLLARR